MNISASKPNGIDVIRLYSTNWSHYLQEDGGPTILDLNSCSNWAELPVWANTAWTTREQPSIQNMRPFWLWVDHLLTIARCRTLIHGVFMICMQLNEKQNICACYFYFKMWKVLQRGTKYDFINKFWCIKYVLAFTEVKYRFDIKFQCERLTDFCKVRAKIEKERYKAKLKRETTWAHNAGNDCCEQDSIPMKNTCGATFAQRIEILTFRMLVLDLIHAQRHLSRWNQYIDMKQRRRERKRDGEK